MRPKEIASDAAQLLARSQPEREFLCFSMGGDLFAFPLLSVAEILKPIAITTVPRAPSHVLGVVSVRGMVITVMDVRAHLRAPLAPPTRATRFLLVHTAEGEIVAAQVDAVKEVLRLTEAQIEPAADLGSDVSSAVLGVGRPYSDGRGVSGPVVLLSPRICTGDLL